MPEEKPKTEKLEGKKSEAEPLSWATASKLERIGIVSSVVFLAISIVFLIFEFIKETETWPYACFDLSIGLAFISETLSNWKKKRTLALITAVCGVIFFVIGILKFFGVM